MCGITGIYAFNEKGEQHLSYVEQATDTLKQRGPDFRATFTSSPVALGHSRLSIIDLSSNGHQPFTDQSGDYTLVFNGEFYNYQYYREQLRRKGISFRSSSDTEVLLYLLIEEGPACLEKVNGFFSFAFFDRRAGELLLARDRFGIKPLYVYEDEDKLIFASEIKAILAYNIKKEIDPIALNYYLQLNYIPAPRSIFRNIEKVMPGTWWKIKRNKAILRNTYYVVDHNESPSVEWSYESAQKKLVELVERSVEKRMIADVPVGTFLSGGIDSSIITAVAAGQNSKLNTFSMGFSDEAFYDETAYAELVARKYNTNHTSYKITKNDLLQQLFETLNYLDEPFADSSALAVGILCQKTRKKATVALSGDGADEVFSGYNKHKATYFATAGGWRSSLLKNTHFLWKSLPKSRDSRFANLFRQLDKLSSGLKLSPKERYWQWAVFQAPELVNELLLTNPDKAATEQFRHELLRAFGSHDSELEQMLLTDVSMVLPDDMLTKVDRMSMMCGLEVRVPFLDHSIVDFAFSLPTHYKIDGSHTKKILRDAFSTYLPKEILERPKHGFEVPLLSWFRNELSDMIENELLSREFIHDQGLFDYDAIARIKSGLRSASPGDAATTTWNLMAFNYWWKNNLSS